MITKYLFKVYYFNPIVFVLFLGLVVITAIGMFCPRDETLEGETYLKTDTLYVEKYDSVSMVQQLEAVYKIVDNQRTRYDQYILNNRSEKLQTRISFIALFTALIFSLFSKEVKNRKMNGGIVLTSLILFGSFYYYDVHTSDLEIRQKYILACDGETAVQILKIIPNIPNKSVKYFYCDKNQVKWVECMKEHTMRRKLGNALRPDLSQISFYFVPMIIVLLLYFLPRIKLKKQFPYISLVVLE